MSNFFSGKAVKLTLNSTIAFLFILCAAPLLARAATITVGPASGNQYQDLQLAINAAQPGDTLLLQAGASFTGLIVLPNKNTSSTQWITLRTSAPDSSLPPAGQRITPSYVSSMAKIVSPGGMPAINTQPGAHHYRLIGIEVTLQSANPCNSDPNMLGYNGCVYNLITLGDYGPNQDTLAEVPHHIEIDRCYVHGLPGVYLKRGIELNSAHTTVVNSHVSEVHAQGQEAQALQGWNGPGPFTIVNNYLEASSINILFGGAQPSIPNVVPSDIEFRNNHCYKQPSWRIGDPNYVQLPTIHPDHSKHWNVKNLFELKSARRVVIEGNIFENTWAGQSDQEGFAVLFTVRGDANTHPWATVEDVLFKNNIVRHAASGVQILGHDCPASCVSTAKRITITNNLFDDINGPKWNNGRGIFLSINEGAENVTVEHNTVFNTGNIIAAQGTLVGNTSLYPNSNFVFRNNITPHNAYGIHGSDRSMGNDTINVYFPGSIIKGNIFPGANQAIYPIDNHYPATLNDVGFVNYTTGGYQGYRLANSSPYKNLGTDQKDPGFDLDAVLAATYGSISGIWQAAYAGSPVAVPAVIEAENFDNGGEGVAYHDVDAGNNGGVYRTTDVDVRTASGSSNGHVVFNAYPGEWLEYSINVQTTGTYNLSASVASRLAGGTFHLEVDGVNVTGTLQAPTTGSWSTFQSVSKNGVSLTAGTHVLRLVLDTAGVEGIIADFDTLSISAGTPVSTPYTGVPVAIPGVIQIENFDLGGEGLAYHDLTTGNSSYSSYRTSDVDMYGDTVLSLQTGEWLKYTVNVGATANTYAVVAQLASDSAGGTFHVEVDGVDVTGIMSIPHTGSWSSWQSAVKTGVSLTAGQRVVRIVIDSGVGFNSFKTLRIVNMGTLTPFSGTASALPGTIAAADFDNGGEQVAYHDITAGCTGYCPTRNTDVDTYGSVIFRAFGGEWTKYTVNVASAGTYTLMVDVGATEAGYTFHVEFDGVDVTGPLTVPNTGNWSVFQTVTKTGVSLSSGQKVMRVVIDGTTPDNGAAGVSINTIKLQ
jgi:hypothetical protein